MAGGDQTENAPTVADWCERGRDLFLTGDYRRALEAFEQAVTLDPRCGEALFGRGVCRYKLKRYRLAKADFDAATLMGCEAGQLWSKFDQVSPEEEENGEGS